MMDTDELFYVVTEIIELVGVGAMIVGFVVSIVITVRQLVTTHDGEAAFRTLKATLGGVILLGLEILVAADLVKTVTSTPSVADALGLSLIVVMRTILSFSLQIEIEGVAPWRKAFVTGHQTLATAVGKANRAVADVQGHPTAK